MRSALAALFLATVLFAGEPSFRTHVIEADIPAGYQTLIVDLNADGKPDVIGLSGRGETLYWYENPSWTRHAIIGGQTQMISVAAADLDGDKIPELALGTHFGQTEAQSEGRLYLLTHDGDPRGPWQAREIDRLPTTHRLRFADIDSDGVPELIDSALTGPGAKAPLFEAKTPLVYLEPGEWKRRVIANDLSGVVHGMYEADWNGPVILTAAMGGVVRFRLGKDGVWERRFLVRGDPRERPNDGASEIRLGKLGGERFLATIEPWHGNQLVVYRHKGHGEWPRLVLDDTLEDGHAVVTADFDGDGNDEIVAGFRGEAADLLLFRYEDGAWKRSVLDDGGMAAAGCDTADLDGDADLDLVCIGARTANIKWYENTAK
ncbi:MAG: VCBS repeat-containing protein [Acidobacteria bacterium]|nr:VCBS repeat-containing protein [Acidobacteriota bacterium]